MKSNWYVMMCLICCSCNASAPKDKSKSVQSRSSKVEIAEVPLQEPEVFTKHDTIFFNERFLVIGNPQMKLDHITAKTKHLKRGSKGDTLFSDAADCILGDFSYVTWVYVKYESKYNFQQFKVDSVCKKDLKLPDLSTFKESPCHSLGVKEWKSKIRSECKKQGVNFAGHFTIIEWGCGAMCQNMCIVDRLSGQVYFPEIPEDQIDGYYGAKYKPDSKMIITNSAILEDHPGYYLSEFDLYPEIFEWKSTVAVRME